MTSGLRPSPETALVDANVFYSQHQRNVFMTLGFERLFTVRWTDRIEREWLDALARNRPDLLFDQLSRTAQRMRDALPDARVEGYEKHEALLTKTDPKDRHVAAGAIACAPATIVTWNIRHFAADELAPRNVTVSDPDAFLCRTFEREPVDTFAATAKAFSFLKRPDGRPSWADYLDILARDRLEDFAALLKSRTPKEDSVDDADDIPTADVK